MYHLYHYRKGLEEAVQQATSSGPDAGTMQARQELTILCDGLEYGSA